MDSSARPQMKGRAMPIDSRPIPTIRRLPTAFESGIEYRAGWRELLQCRRPRSGLLALLAVFALLLCSCKSGKVVGRECRYAGGTLRNCCKEFKEGGPGHSACVKGWMAADAWRKAK